MNRLIDYPNHTFTQKQLLDFQTQGVCFSSNSWRGLDDFVDDLGRGYHLFDSFGSIDYIVTPCKDNIALFEKLANIHPKKTPRVHAEVIKAWADDTTSVIQRLNELDDTWVNLNQPTFHPDFVYRIKPTESDNSEQILKDIQQGLTTGIATCIGLLLLKEEV